MDITSTDAKKGAASNQDNAPESSKQANSNSEKPNPGAEREYKFLSLLSEDLAKRSTYMLITGITVFVLSFGLALYLYNDIKTIIDEQVKEIKNTEPGQKTSLVTVYLIFRILTLGSIVTALLIFAYNIIKASFDQSVRFAKRKHGALFLEFLHAEYGQHIKDASLDKFNESFEAWNKTTESSFTSIKVSKRNSFADAIDNISSSLKEIKDKIPRNG